MKVFIVISSLNGGGAERVGVLLANGLALKGNKVWVVTDLSKPVIYQVNEKVTLLDMASVEIGKIAKWYYSCLKIRKYIKLYQPEFIVGIMQLCSFVSRIASIGTKTHVIMTEHDSFERPGSAPMSLLAHFCKFYLNRIYECVTVITQADKDFIGDRLKNVVVMPNPLLLAPVNAMPQKKRVILAAGRLDAWHYKGFDVLIRAWALVNGKLKIDNGQLGSNGESWKLQIAGTGSEDSLNFLKQLCRENGVEDSVEFLGFRKDVEKLYQDASVFVLSSRYEGFGLVLIEAMSQGCACVACDYKGRQREIMNPTLTVTKGEWRTSKGIEACENGILCEPDNVESLAAGIQKMIDDDEYRSFVSGNSVVRSNNYNLEKTIIRWTTFLSSNI